MRSVDPVIVTRSRAAVTLLVFALGLLSLTTILLASAFRQLLASHPPTEEGGGGGASGAVMERWGAVNLPMLLEPGTELGLGAEREDFVLVLDWVVEGRLHSEGQGPEIVFRRSADGAHYGLALEPDGWLELTKRLESGEEQALAWVWIPDLLEAARGLEIECRDTRLQVSLDGAPVLLYADPVPLAGEGVALRSGDVHLTLLQFDLLALDGAGPEAGAR
jgi:hypothetical protein